MLARDSLALQASHHLKEVLFFEVTFFKELNLRQKGGNVSVVRLGSLLLRHFENVKQLLGVNIHLKIN